MPIKLPARNVQTCGSMGLRRFSRKDCVGSQADHLPALTSHWPLGSGFPQAPVENAHVFESFLRCGGLAHRSLIVVPELQRRDSIPNATMNTEAQLERIDEQQSKASAVSPTPRKRILLADDSPQIRESLSKLLRGAGYFVGLVANGAHTLDRVLQEDFDLLLLDLNMPGIDGWETLENLAILKPKLPVIIITAQPDQREWALIEGAKGLMEKPLDPALLLQTIRELTSESSPNVRVDPPEKFRFRTSDRPATTPFGNRHRWDLG